MQAGAQVGGSDEAFAHTAVKDATRTHDLQALHSWSIAGIKTLMDKEESPKP